MKDILLIINTGMLVCLVLIEFHKEWRRKL